MGWALTRSPIDNLSGRRGRGGRVDLWIDSPIDTHVTAYKYRARCRSFICSTGPSENRTCRLVSKDVDAIICSSAANKCRETLELAIMSPQIIFFPDGCRSKSKERERKERRERERNEREKRERITCRFLPLSLSLSQFMMIIVLTTALHLFHQCYGYLSHFKSPAIHPASRLKMMLACWVSLAAILPTLQAQGLEIVQGDVGRIRRGVEAPVRPASFSASCADISSRIVRDSWGFSGIGAIFS